MKKHLVFLEEHIFAPVSSAVLLIEGDEVTRDTTTGMLHYLGYTVEAVDNVEEAVSLYKLRKEEGNPFKAVIFDISHSEDPGGKETLRQLLEYDPEIKAIASSGLTGKKIAADPGANGFQASLPRHYSIKQLGSVLRAVIDSASGKEGLTNVRREVRHGIVAHFQFVDGDKPGDVCEGVTMNISKHGFGFLTEATVAEGQAISVTNHDLQSIVGCKAQVIWVKKGRGHIWAGAKFIMPC